MLQNLRNNRDSEVDSIVKLLDVFQSELRETEAQKTRKGMQEQNVELKKKMEQLIQIARQLQ